MYLDIKMPCLKIKSLIAIPDFSKALANALCLKVTLIGK